MKKKRTIFWIIVISLCIISGCSSKKEMIFYDFPLEKQDIDKVLLTNELKWTAEEETSLRSGQKFYYIVNENGKYMYGLSSEKDGKKKTLNIIVRRVKFDQYEANLHADASVEEELKILNSAIELFASTMDGERLYKSAAEYYKEKSDQVDVAYEVKKDGDYYTLIFLKEKWSDTYFLKSINISNKST